MLYVPVSLSHCFSLKVFLYFITIVFVLFNAKLSCADSDPAQVRMGLKLFRTILASDVRIRDKSVDDLLHLVLVYKKNKSKAKMYANKLYSFGRGRNKGKIKKHKIKIHLLSTDELHQLESIHPAGIFILDRIPDAVVRHIARYATENSIISFSPYDGDVVKGITAGIVIEATVRPLINTHVLKQANIRLKSYYLKISKHYEP